MVTTSAEYLKKVATFSHIEDDLQLDDNNQIRVIDVSEKAILMCIF